MVGAKLALLAQAGPLAVAPKKTTLPITTWPSDDRYTEFLEILGLYDDVASMHCTAT